jgi:cysteine desulfurase
MAQGIYLDNSTTTRPSEKTIAAMLPFLTEKWGTPSAPHQMGQELFPAIEESYRALYQLLGAKESDDVIFTSSGAEAVNQVILSAYLDITRSTGKNQFVTSNIDEAPSIMSVGRLEQLGCVAKMAKANAEGQVTSQAIADVITPRTALVSLSWANGLTGVIHPVGEIATLCQERGILFHLDATHILGKLFYELEDVGAQLITFNGDNLHGPKGTGGLYIKEGTPCSPLIVGGFEQGGHRAGSFNVAGLVGLGQAAKEALDARNLVCTEVARLRNKLEAGIKSGFPDAVLFYQEQERLPNCGVISFPGISNEAMLYALNRKGVYASIGGGTFQQLGLLLMASGVEESLAHSAINFSLSREITENDIDRAITIICETAHKLRKISDKLIPTRN